MSSTDANQPHSSCGHEHVGGMEGGKLKVLVKRKIVVDKTESDSDSD